jgi:hypothetical protein
MKFDGAGAGSGDIFFPASVGGLEGLMLFTFYTCERIRGCQRASRRFATVYL